MQSNLRFVVRNINIKILSTRNDGLKLGKKKTQLWRLKKYVDIPMEIPMKYTNFLWFLSCRNPNLPFYFLDPSLFPENLQKIPETRFANSAVTPTPNFWCSSTEMSDASRCWLLHFQRITPHPKMRVLPRTIWKGNFIFRGTFLGGVTDLGTDTWDPPNGKRENHRLKGALGKDIGTVPKKVIRNYPPRITINHI